jgi:hypothetical protein
MIVDGRRDQLFILSKDSERSDVFRADLSHLRSGDHLRLRRIGRLPFSYVTAADLSGRFLGAFTQLGRAAWRRAADP